MARLDSDSSDRRARLSTAERRHSIAMSAAKLFAEQGFEATGSRDLARASGISEALMFRHFSSKDELWYAALEACRQFAIADAVRAADNRPPSARGLVGLAFHLAGAAVGGEPGSAGENRETLQRMLLRSLAGDGQFARVVMSDLGERLNGYLIDCLSVADAEGELEPSDEAQKPLVSAFCRLLFFGVAAQSVSSDPVMEFGATREVLIENLVRFQLRGMGLRNMVAEREIALLLPHSG